ncbi:MAG: ABC transporter permease [Terracidiphilus sp.]
MPERRHFIRSIRQIFGRRERYRDLSVSIQEHIAERADELVEEGIPRAQAEQAARREFGNVALIEQRSREAWQWPVVESILSDLKFTLRRLLKAPGFTIAVLLTLAVGIGANTAVFTVVDSILLKPLPYPDSDHIVSLSLDAPGAGGLATGGLNLSPSMYLTFSRHNHAFQSLGIWVPRTSNVTGVAQPEQVQMEGVSDGVLQTLAVPPAVGRWLSPADQNPQGAKTVMLGYGYWQRRFGGERTAIGRAINVDGETRTIVGVMPRGFRMVDQEFDILVPLALDPTNQKLGGFGYYGIGRLKPGVTLQQANADIAPLVNVWMDSWSNGPHTYQHYYDIWHITPNFRPLKQLVVGDVGSVLWLVLSTVGLVMLVACTNVANLLLVRAESRHQELAVRSALGAGRARIARELLVESLVLGLIGGAVAIGVAYAGLRLLVAIGPAELPRLNEVALDGRSLVFTLLLSVLSGLLFGSIPAFKYARSGASLKLGASSRTASEGRAFRRSRDMLVVAQVAMALVLMVCSLLMIRTFAALRSVEPGFADPSHIELLSVWIPDLIAADPHQVARMQYQIEQNLAAIPGVTSAAFAADVPMDGNDANWDQIAVEGKTYDGGEGPLQLYNYVSPGYFRTMGTRIVAGRDFTWDDLNNLGPMVIVSESFARESWGSAAAAIGKRLRQYSSSPWQQVVGVVEDVHVHGMDQKAPAMVYWPTMFPARFSKLPQMGGLRFVSFVMHTSRAGTEGLLTQMQQAVWSINSTLALAPANSNLPVGSTGTLQQLCSRSMARTSFTLVMLAIAGSMAMALSLIGIYGVISYAVSQRTREIGIRLALGAQKGLMRWMFVRAALVLTAFGAGIGLCAAAALARLMKALLFGVSPLDPLTFAAVPIILALAAAVASFLPASRAAAVNPADALRAE